MAKDGTLAFNWATAASASFGPRQGCPIEERPSGAGSHEGAAAAAGWRDTADWWESGHCVRWVWESR